MGFEAFRVGSAYLAIADRGDVVFVSQVAPHNPIRAFFRPGTRGFMHASGIGKALLANMSHDEVEKIPQKKRLSRVHSQDFDLSDRTVCRFGPYKTIRMGTRR